MSLILIGFMGAGKSTIASRLSENYVDTDDYIEKKFKLNISDFIQQSGIEAFRKLEEEVLPELIENFPVIATGGGIVESEKNQQLLRKEKEVIYLQADFEILLHRLQKDSENLRPLFKNDETLKELYEARKAVYEELADFTVDTSQMTIKEIVNLIKNKTILS